jgi:hypothetical protein
LTPRPFQNVVPILRKVIAMTIAPTERENKGGCFGILVGQQRQTPNARATAQFEDAAIPPTI